MALTSKHTSPNEPTSQPSPQQPIAQSLQGQVFVAWAHHSVECQVKAGESIANHHQHRSTRLQHEQQLGWSGGHSDTTSSPAGCVNTVCDRSLCFFPRAVLSVRNCGATVPAAVAAVVCLFYSVPRKEKAALVTTSIIHSFRLCVPASAVRAQNTIAVAPLQGSTAALVA